MAAIFQSTSSNAFSWIKMFEFQIKFNWILFLRVNVWISNQISMNFVSKGQIDNIPASARIMAWCLTGKLFIWTNDDLLYWRIYASLGLNELILNNSPQRWSISHEIYTQFAWCFFIFSMMTSSNENIFRVTGPLCGEFTGRRWILLTKASDAELWCFLWSANEQTVEETIVRLVMWDAIALIMTSL